MQITIHRGINQIGSCITEIATSNTRILIDLGLNLPDNKGVTTDNLAAREPIEKLTEGIDAIIYTHYHGDHIGLFNFVPKHIPQYIGEVAQKVCICKHKKLGQIDGREQISAEEVTAIKAMKTMRARGSFFVGDIRITPYFVSHSAYESFMFLIEAEGKRILHTGDFREHSYLGKGLEPTLKKYIGEIDILITEGTMISRADERVRPERDLQEEFKQIMKEYKNCFVISSSTDLERLASVRAAHKETKSEAPFICDGFQKDILKIFSDNLTDKSSLWNFEKVYDYRTNNMKLNNWMQNTGFTMLIRATGKYDNWLEKILPQLEDSQTVVVFSMWGQYINSESVHAKESFLNTISKFKNIRKLHTSGHASRDSLAKVCRLTSPRLAIIPIHSECSAKYSDLDIPDVLKNRVVLKTCTLVEDVSINVL